MPENIIQLSQELDKAVNRFERGEITKDALEGKRSELYKELKGWEDSREDRKWW